MPDTTVLDRLTDSVQPLHTRMREAEWTSETTGTPESFATLERLEVTLAKRLSDADDFAAVKNLLDSDAPAGQKRQARRWHDRMASRQVAPDLLEHMAAAETRLKQSYNAFRAVVDGKPVADNHVDAVLRTSTDSAACEAVWTASKRIAHFTGTDADQPPVWRQLVDLVDLRNRAAREIGHADGYHLHMATDELEVDGVFAILGQLGDATDPLFADYTGELDGRLADKFGVPAAELRPWHYGDRFFQSPPPAGETDTLDDFFRGKTSAEIVDLTHRTMDAFGHDARPVTDRSDLLPGDPATSRKCQHAFCTTVRPGEDVRVLCNIAPGRRWMSTNLHEYGHAIYGRSLSTDLPYVLQDDPQTLVNEAIALLMERHLFDARWLTDLAGMDAGTADQVAAGGRRQLARRLLVFTRWVLTMCHFERSLYAEPVGEELPSRWWELAGRFQGLRCEPPRDDKQDWAAKVHFLAAPVYYQNYLLGECVASQLEHFLTGKFGSVYMNADAGAYLRDRMFAVGATYRWDELVEHVTGKPLDVSHFARAVGRWND